jgi:hypothetical protein
VPGFYGCEVQFVKTVALRVGQLYDRAGSRNELHVGLGGSWCNHFAFDWSYIHSPRQSVARDGQWGISFTFFNIAFWRAEDMMWWRVPSANASPSDESF